MQKEQEQKETMEQIGEFGQIEMDHSRQQHNIFLLSIIGEVEGP